MPLPRPAGGISVSSSRPYPSTPASVATTPLDDVLDLDSLPLRDATPRPFPIRKRTVRVWACPRRCCSQSWEVSRIGLTPQDFPFDPGTLTASAPSSKPVTGEQRLALRRCRRRSEQCLNLACCIMTRRVLFRRAPESAALAGDLPAYRSRTAGTAYGQSEHPHLHAATRLDHDRRAHKALLRCQRGFTSAP